MTVAQIIVGAIITLLIAVTSTYVITNGKKDVWRLLGMLTLLFGSTMFTILWIITCTQAGTYKDLYEREIKRQKDSTKYEMVIDTLYRKK